MAKQNLRRLTAEIDFNLIKEFKMRLLSKDIKYKKWLEIKIKEFLVHNESGKRQTKTTKTKANKAASPPAKDTESIEELIQSVLG